MLIDTMSLDLVVYLMIGMFMFYIYDKHSIKIQIGKFYLNIDDVPHMYVVIFVWPVAAIGIIYMFLVFAIHWMLRKVGCGK